LTITIGLLGWRIAYQGTARAWTEAPSTLRGLWRQRYRWAYGTMQAAWKHRRAIGGRAITGPGGATTHLGRVGLPYLLVFGVLLPLLGPLVDVFTVVGLVFTSPTETAIMWGTFNGIQVVLAAYALRLDGERLRTLWALPFQQIVYRQVMYLVVLEAALGAVTGRRLRWHKVARTGSAADALQSAQDTPVIGEPASRRT
jgi:cellulose synthase/poly-beta-1,6-N-acetylglucosamine synthase-like glycosyltransferase